MFWSVMWIFIGLVAGSVATIAFICLADERQEVKDEQLRDQEI